MTDHRTATTPDQDTAKPPTGTPAIVEVVARTKPGGGVGFTYDWRWQDGTPGGSGPITVPARKQTESGTPIHFNLRDETNPRRGLDFTDDADGPMWVLRDDCPPEGTKCEDPEIPPSKMHRSPNLLRVFDENAEECTLRYRLRFKDRQGQPVSDDPEIRNGGTI